MNATVHQPEFMLLFRNTQFEQRLSAEEMAEAMRRLNVWLERWSASGHIKSGQPLSYDGKIISGAKQRMVADGPFAESKEVIGGYLMLDVETLDEALAIAKSYPCLQYGISIEVRPLLTECPCFKRARERLGLATEVA